MTTVSDVGVDLQSFSAELRRRANAHYTTPQHLRLMSVPLSVERAQVWALQTQFFLTNRRDCWAFTQGLSPLDVKALIWKHEEDELAGNAERGVEDHGSLAIREGGVLGLTPDDFLNNRIAAATRTVTYAWIRLVKDSPWLKAVSACAALEISNSSEWVDGGGMSYRRGKRLESELGIPFEKQVSAVEHNEVEVEHAHMLLKIAERHATTPQLLDLMLEGAIESWEIDTTWKGLQADLLEAVPLKR